jgi:iron-sulfur cluster protein
MSSDERDPGKSRGSHDARAAEADRLRQVMDTEGEAIGENTRTVNQLSAFATSQFDDYEDARTAARAIKEGAIERLPELLEQVSEAVEANGGQVHLARTAEDANRIIEGIMAERDAERLVKSKSMTTEEIAVNDHLTGAGYDVVETDLGEYVIQLADEEPSHLIGPAIHKSPDDIATLFNGRFDLTGDDALSENPHELTAFAREKVGEEIRRADAGMTGANFVVAETGTIALVTNEGNARKSAVTPETHIAVAGVEKLVPSVVDLAPFTELIARSGTGQDITSYLSLLTPPVETPIPDFEADTFRPAADREFHLVLLDNGRMATREDDDLRETLYCIRCGACSNSCANFQEVGGHAFGGETYTGGIGTGWEASVHGLDSAEEMNDLCTGCSRCVPRCPVKIDIPWINTVVRDRLNRGRDPETLDFLVDGLAPDEESAGLDPQKRLFGNVETLAKLGSKTPRLANTVTGSRPGQWLLERVGVDSRADLPTLAGETLREWYGERGPQVESPERDVVLYPDLYTEYFDPARGKAAVATLEALGVRVHIPPVPESGRAPLSQGMVETARDQAEAVHGTLVTHLDRGRDVVVVEPSDLAMVREDYGNLLPAQSADRLAEHSYGVMEYVYGLLENGADTGALSTAGSDVTVAYHPHCQGRTLGIDAHATAVLEAVGYDVRTSSVECCGMAGSFGYKREYYEVSESVGEQLRADLGETAGERLVASGTSCSTRLETLYDRPAPHPVELLAPTGDGTGRN